MTSPNQETHRLNYLPLEPLKVFRPVNRFDYICARCHGLRILDLGALDETEITKAQHSSWQWLHAAIAGVAGEVLGVDSSQSLKEAGSLKTPCGTTIQYGSVEDLGDVLRTFKPELIVAGELIEHTPNTLGWLSQVGKEQPGVKILLTTPNATSIVNIILSFLNRENTHQDHLHIYSYKTLATLARRLKLEAVRFTPYYYHSELFRGRTPKPLVLFVYMFDYLLLTPLQFLFPMAAGGIILEGKFPDCT